MNGRATTEVVSPTTTTACAKKTENAGEAGKAGRATTAPEEPGTSGPAARRATAG
ncbi:hypothetical protein [Streptomyces sp. Wb2n-11]|uniref:hypothetical protein n=1 Tax=Streptomyces sp. Wb2n-11 TaxID=1030533 RepID=UPI00159ED736|nr:hypothetical protein [Streptomyces sp. Wb2n-11]